MLATARRAALAARLGGAARGLGTRARERVLVTTPIFYVNGLPHIGHAYSGLLADALSRWLRFKGHEVVFSTGTDEHGAKVQKAAEAAGFESCQAYCDSVSQSFRDLFTALGCSNDVFVRTTDEQHKRTVRNLWRRLQATGAIQSGSHSGWYCQSDETFLLEEQVLDDPARPGGKVSCESGHVVEWIEEQNYLFDLPQFGERLVEWMHSERDWVDAVSPRVRRNEIASFVQGNPLRPLSVSRPRDRVGWAIPVPEDDSQSIYVWLDALANYLTVTGVEVSPDPNVPMSWRDAGVDRVVHVVGKDIIRFHALYWPAFLLAAGMAPPDQVIAHAHWTVERTKMSKSLGNVLCPREMLCTFEVDALRYALLRNGGLANDADFSVSVVASRRREELANTLGNLLSRSLAKGIWREPHWPSEHVCDDPSRSALAGEHLRGLAERVDEHFTRLEFARGLGLVAAALHEANRMFTAEEPWAVRKRLRALTALPEAERRAQNAEALETEGFAQLETTVFWVLETLRVCGLLLSPAVPDTSARILDALGVPADERTFEHARKLSRASDVREWALARPRKVLFPAIELEECGNSGQAS